MESDGSQSLQGTDGKTHKLSEYRGKTAVVIAWFPKAFTGGCTIECKSLADNGDKIQKYDVTYFMASTDPIEENIKFAKATGAEEVVLFHGDKRELMVDDLSDFAEVRLPVRGEHFKFGK